MQLPFEWTCIGGVGYADQIIFLVDMQLSWIQEQGLYSLAEE